MAIIQAIKGREILDSRGNPTVEVELETARGKGLASVPSGASVGVHEAHELRDDGPGRGVSKAVAHVNETIAVELAGKEFDQQLLDNFLCRLDGTADKSRLGANAVLGVSMAFARAQAAEQGMPLYAYVGALDARTVFRLPQPICNVLNGGKHARGGIDIQECMLAPIGFDSMRDRMRAVEACMSALEALLKQKGCSSEVGDEGGFAPSLATNDEALELLLSSIAAAGYTTDQVRIALDIAASSFYTDGSYVLKTGGHAQTMSKEDMLEWYGTLAGAYPLISIEDPFAEDDYEAFAMLTERLGGTLCVVGDDLTVTNVGRIRTAIQEKSVNACIIKPNQVGTVSEAVQAVKAAREAGWKIFASHRSGETMDTFIADFAVGLSCDYVKAGAPTRKERSAKYNRLMEIESHIA